MTRSYRPRLNAIGLTYPQYLVMLVLWQDGSHSIRHIAARLNLASSAITPLLDRLEEAGFARRESGGTDRRVIKVSLTEAGKALEHDAALAQREVACATGLEPDALEELRDQLRAMVEDMEGEMATQPTERRDEAVAAR